MDDTTLASLQAALAASPDNGTLRALVLKALLDRNEVEQARSGAPERALPFCTAPSAEASLQRLPPQETLYE